MNYVKAICGHFVVAVGAPGSKAREEACGSLCEACLMKQVDAICDSEDYLNDDGGNYGRERAGTGQVEVGRRDPA